MTRSTPHRQLGMTLVELIVALTLMAILMAMAYGALRVAMRANDAARESANALNEVRVAQQLIRRQLRAALPVRGQATDASAGPARVFDGSRDHMRFVGPMPGYLGGGVHVQEIWIEGEGTDQRLMFRHRLAHPEASPGGTGDVETPVLLIDHLSHAEFSYLDSEPGTSSMSQWRSDWDPPERFPALVRLQARRADGRRAPWPLLVVAPKVTHARWSDSVDTRG